MERVFFPFYILGFDLIKVKKGRERVEVKKKTEMEVGKGEKENER